MHLQHLPGYFEANCFMEEFTQNPDFRKAVERIKNEAMKGNDSFIASILVHAHMGATPVESD